MIGSILSGVAYLKYSDAATTVTCDGNSITNGDTHTTGTAAHYPNQLAALAPISGQFSCLNLGISGQTTRMMNGLDGGSTADVDAAFIPGKKNILIAWEGTNSELNGRTGTQWAQDMADYVAARIAANPGWIIVLMTTLPYILSNHSQAQTNQENADIEVANNIMRANYRSWGAKAIVDLRDVGSPFHLPDYTLASFEAAGVVDLWSKVEGAGNHLHLYDTGMAYVAARCAGVLKRLRR